MTDRAATVERVLEIQHRYHHDIVQALASLWVTGDWQHYEHPVAGLRRADTFSDFLREALGIHTSQVREWCHWTSGMPASETLLRALDEEET